MHVFIYFPLLESLLFSPHYYGYLYTTPKLNLQNIHSERGIIKDIHGANHYIRKEEYTSFSTAGVLWIVSRKWTFHYEQPSQSVGC